MGHDVHTGAATAAANGGTSDLGRNAEADPSSRARIASLMVDAAAWRSSFNEQ